MAARIRAFDWAATPLGPIDTWPQNRKAAVDLMLAHPFPMTTLWGADIINVYNDAYIPVLGDKHPATLGRPHHDVWPELRHVNHPLLQRVWAGETISLKDVAFPSQRRDGIAEAWSDLALSPLRDEAGRITGALATVFETTDRVLAEKARDRIEAGLRDREADLARVQRIGQVGGLDIDVAGGLRSRRSFEYMRVHGLPSDGAAAWLARVHPDDRERAERALFSALDSNATFYTSEYRIVRLDDGAVRWIEARADIKRDHDGTAGRLVGAHIDVTERKLSEEALRESRERFRALVTAGTLSTYRMSPDWRLMYQLDSGSLAITAEPIEDWVDKYILDEDPPRGRAAIDEAIRTRSLFELEHRVRLADGSVGWVLSRAVPLLGPDGNGLVPGATRPIGRRPNSPCAKARSGKRSCSASATCFARCKVPSTSNRRPCGCWASASRSAEPGSTKSRPIRTRSA